MDLFKFQSPTSVTKLEYGIFINDIKSIMWVERYRDAGEFQLVVPAESAVRKQLTIGSYISHVKTPEVMIVENHEIRDDRNSEPELVITGRSFETILDTRIVGSNRTFPVVGPITDYDLGVLPVWQAALTLAQNHLTNLINTSDQIQYLTFALVGSAPGDALSARRVVKTGSSVYSSFLDLLSVDNLGVRNVRPGIWDPTIGPVSQNTLTTVHIGVDRTHEIIFSYTAGEIESADYLWSNKKFKNAAFVTTKWVQTFVFTSGIRSYRRVMHVDASYIDEDLTVAPTGTALSDVITAAQQSGLDVLKSQNNITLTKAEVSKEAVKYKYRDDYNVGDLVSIVGDYNAISTMRVNEFVEIEDETGEYGYPTFTTDQEN